MHKFKDMVHDTAHDTGHDTAHNTGHNTGQVTGEPTGQVTGEPTGEPTGETTGETTGELAGEPGGELARKLHEGIKRAVLVMDGELKRTEIQEILQLKHQEFFRDNYLIPAMEEGYIEMTIPETPNHPNQKYRLTSKRMALQQLLKNKK